MHNQSVNVSRLNIELYNRVTNTNNKLFTRNFPKIKHQRKTKHKGMENVIPHECQASQADETTLTPNKTESKVNDITKDKEKYLIMTTYEINQKDFNSQEVLCI